MSPLGRNSRAVLAAAAFASFAGAYVTTPIAPGSAAVPPVTVAPLVTPSPKPTPIAVVIPRRDPFAGEPQPEAAPMPERDMSARTTSEAPPFSPAFAPPSARALLPLPPNAGAASQPFPFSTASPAQPPAVRVVAVITGPHPYALIEDAGTTRLVTTGDRIGADTIGAITSSQVRLTNGSVLWVTPPQSVAPLAPKGLR